jgi:hypothetical protein
MPAEPATSRRDLGQGELALLALACFAAALAIYAPALHGAFVSDDFHYLVNNAWLHELSLGNALAILDPTGPTAINVVNYSPVQLLIHAVAWESFGRETFGHHLINVCLHALASILLVLLFVRQGIPRVAAALGGAFFLVHPANVEAVAWISQLKTSASLVLSLLALLAWPRRPWVGVLLFALALLAKATAACVLPVALLFEWSETGRVRWRFAAAAAVALAAFSVAEFSTHQRTGAAEATLHETPLVLVRTVAALGLRYLVIAGSSWGVSAFHEPEPAHSPLDPWWLASLPVYALLGWRLVVLARRASSEWRTARIASAARSEPQASGVERAASAELAFWAWALVSFGPVSQIFPFLYPMADRYLYFILPGLVGAALLAGAEAAARLSPPPRAVVALAAIACVALGVRAHERARIWRSSATLHADAAAHYPDGTVASLVAARRAAFAGDADASLTALERAVSRGYNRFDQLESDAVWDALREDARFRQLVRGVAAGWIERSKRKASPTQTELRVVAHAHVARQEYADALRVYAAAVAAGGPDSDAIRAEIEAVRSVLASGNPNLRLRLGATSPDQD